MAFKTMRKSYTDVAERVVAAVRELNAALVEAHEHPKVRVYMIYLEAKAFLAAQAGQSPMRYGCEVTRLTKHAIVVEPGISDTLHWRLKIAEKQGKKAKRAKKSQVRKAV